MKVRKGYVSNSSSSSFICDVCGRSEVGYDASPSDFEMYEGSCGHVFCQNEINTDYTLKTMYDSIKDCGYNNTFEDLLDFLQKEIDNYGEDYIPTNEFKEDIIEKIENLIGSSDVPNYLCPVCFLKYIPYEEKYNYVTRKFYFSDEEIEKEIRNSFKNIDELKKYSKGK